MPIAHLPQPFQPRAQASVVRRSLWLLPGALAILFVAVVAWWAGLRDAQEVNDFRQTLISDASSVDLLLGGRKDAERAKLREAAAHLPRISANADVELSSLPGVVAGLDRLWNRLVWLDADNQVIGMVARRAPRVASATEALRIQSRGQADHFVEPVAAADGRPSGQLLARYDITELLQSTDLAWLTRRYEVEFLSDLGEIIATTSRPSRPPQGLRHESPLTAFQDTTLRLTPYDALTPWWRKPGTLALLGGLLLLGGAASQLLRREMQRVALAVRVSQSESAWRQSMEDSALVGLRARDAAGRILYVNKTLCEMVGYSPAELVGLVPPLPFWPADAVDDMLARNQLTLGGQAPRSGTESRWQHRDGHRIDVMVFESPLVNAQGQHIGWMGSIVDVTERKRLAETERKQSEVLARHARLTMLGEMVSSLAHDINQPLTVIANYAEGLLRRVQRQTAPDTSTQQALEAIGKNAALAGRIVVNVRERLGRHQVVRAFQDINAVVTVAVDLQRQRIAGQEVQLLLALAPDLPELALDRVGIEQVVTNLVRNAVDALSDVPAHRRIHVETRLVPAGGPDETPESVCIEVRDNGPGLQGRSIEALSVWSYSTKADGLGMGLAICRYIVEEHGGTLCAGEAPGGGALFGVRLPVSVDTFQEEMA